MHFGTLSWVSAIFGQGLVLMFLLSAIHLLLHFAAQNREPPAWALLACLFLMVLGFMCYGTGTAVTFVFPAVAWFLTPARCRPWRVALYLSPLLLVPVLHLALARSGHGTPILFSLGGTLRLWVQLATYGASSLVLGPFFARDSSGAAGWPVTSLSPQSALQVSYPLAAALAAWLAWTYRRANPDTRRVLPGVFLVFAAPYGLIAAGRGIFLGVYGALPMVPHYHYLSMSGAAILIGVAASMWEPGNKSRRWRRATGLALGICIGTLSVGSVLIESRMPNVWAIAGRIKAAETRSYFKSRIDEAAGDSMVFIENNNFEPLGDLVPEGKKPEVFPKLAGYFAMVYDSNTVRGRKIRFVERDLDRLERIWSGSSRMRELVVGRLPDPIVTALRKNPQVMSALHERIPYSPDVMRVIERALAEASVPRSEHWGEDLLAIHLDPTALAAIRGILQNDPDVTAAMAKAAAETNAPP